MKKITGIFKNHRARAIVFVVVIAIAGLATLQQVSKNQDIRQRASSDVGLEFSMSSTKVAVGQQFDAVVVLNNSANKAITSFDVIVAYDSKAISYVNSSVIYPFQGLITTSTPESGKIRIAGTIEGNSTLPDLGNYSYAKLINITFTGKSPSSSTLGFSNTNVAALDEAKSVVNWIKTTPIEVVTNTNPSGSPTPTQFCKSGINSFAATQDGCQSGKYRTVKVGCYDNYSTTVSTPSCTSYEEILKYATQFCEGRTSCSPKITITPTLQPSPIMAVCDIDRSGTVNEKDYAALIQCTQQYSPNDICANSDFNRDGKVNLDDVNIFLRQCPMPTPASACNAPCTSNSYCQSSTSGCTACINNKCQPPILTPTPTPTTYGNVYIITSPDAQTVRLLTSSGKTIKQATGKISQQQAVGNYYVSFAISNRNTKNNKTPVTKAFSVKKGRTTTIIGDFKTGKTTVTTN